MSALSSFKYIILPDRFKNKNFPRPIFIGIRMFPDVTDTLFTPSVRSTNSGNRLTVATEKSNNLVYDT